MNMTSRVVVGLRDGSLRALGAADGAMLWQRQGNHPYALLALTSAASVVIAVALDGQVTAHAADGEVCWTCTPFEHSPGDIFPPGNTRILADPAQAWVVIQFGKQIVALNPLDGSERWRYRSAAHALGLLAVGRYQLYVTETLRLPPPPSGATEPKTTANPMEQASRTRPTRGPTKQTTALRLADGTPVWTTRQYFADQPAWDGASSLIEVEDVVYCAGAGIHALDASTGTLLWTREREGTGSGMLAYAGSYLLLCALERLVTYERSTGAVIWSLPAHDKDGYFERLTQTIVTGERLYLARSMFNPHGMQIECRDTQTGTLRWVWPTNSATLDPDDSWRLRIGDGNRNLYVPASRGLYAVRAADGHPIWFDEYRGTLSALLALSSQPA